MITPDLYADSSGEMEWTETVIDFEHDVSIIPVLIWWLCSSLITILIYEVLANSLIVFATYVHTIHTFQTNTHVHKDIYAELRLVSLGYDGTKYFVNNTLRDKIRGSDQLFTDILISEMCKDITTPILHEPTTLLVFR